MNNKIQAKEVRLIGAEGEQLGVVSLEKALQLALEEELDLVEVAPQADPPVCRIMDYGKYKYRMKKKMHKSKQKARQIQVKEIQIRPKTDIHDYNFKMNHARRFLVDGNKAKITMLFRGREMSHVDIGKQMLVKMAQELTEISIIEREPKLEGNHMIMILAPKDTSPKLS
ncbi:translation initiation factor IF-3 [bacterium]|nr:translation initiation factor IF-3 [bacterium]